MAYTKVNYEEVEQVSSAMHFLREPLETDQVGVTVVRCDPGWKSQRHDHTDNEHEEVYVLIDGSATVVVDEQSIPVEEGDALWISPYPTRQIRNGDEESAFVLVSAPSIADESDDQGEWLVSGFAG
ncbi:MAG: cupin domain-containing protein [Natrialbaceae archaeon]|nr:cupin domain-containing protein [Natrialbaceae archaeon]